MCQLEQVYPGKHHKFVYPISISHGISNGYAHQISCRGLLIRYAPPQDFQKFVAEIRELWISGGLILDDLNANPNQHDPNYGPNLYQVNEQYVKLGGTGKLKRQCQVFFFWEK